MPVYQSVHIVDPEVINLLVTKHNRMVITLSDHFSQLTFTISFKSRQHLLRFTEMVNQPVESINRPDNR